MPAQHQGFGRVVLDIQAPGRCQQPIPGWIFRGWQRRSAQNISPGHADQAVDASHARGQTADRGIGSLRVRCNAIRDRAHRFYERLGFQTTKSQKVFDIATDAPRKRSASV